MKTKRLIILLIIILSSNTAYILADTEFEFSGYVYDVPSVQKIPAMFEDLGYETDDEYLALNLTRLRLRPNVILGDYGRITAQYEMDFLLSKLALPYLTGSGMTNRQAVGLNWQVVNDDYLKVNHFIDMLYYKHFFDFGEIVFGRQVISWGTGRIWQPTDLFNPINPANFSKFEKDGADALSAKIFLGDFSDLELVYNFREKLKDGNFAGRFRTNYKEYDISVMAGYFDKRAVVGGDFAGNLFDAGFRGEFLYSFHDKDPDSNFVRCILGLDYQFTSKLYAMTEFQYNGEGTTCTNCYQIDKMFMGEILNVGKYYGMAQISYEIHPLVKINLSNLTNIGDGSGYAGFTGVYSALDNLNLSLGAMLFYGKNKTEYSYFPSAFYAVVEYYF